MFTDRHLFIEYKCNRGGLGDLWKGGFFTFCIAKLTNRDFAFDLRPHIINKIYPTSVSVINNTYDDQKIIFNEQSYIGLNLVVKDIMSSDKKCIKFITNRWRYEAFLPFNDIKNNIHLWLKQYSELFRANFNINLHVIRSKHYILDEFIVFHCRLGDKYLDETTQGFKYDNRISSLQILENKISYFVKEVLPNCNTKRVMICSDNADTIQNILKKIPNSFTVCPNPRHFAFPCDKTNFESIRNTFEEHGLISQAIAIYICSYSGYPLTASLENDIPVYLIEDNSIIDYYESGVKKDDTFYIKKLI